MDNKDPKELIQIDRETLRSIVDVAWGCAMEDGSLIGHKTSDEIIDHAIKGGKTWTPDVTGERPIEKLCVSHDRHYQRTDELLRANNVNVERRRLATIEIIELKSSVVAFGVLVAAKYAKDNEWPDGEIHPTHYDILEDAGARMNDFTRKVIGL